MLKQTGKAASINYSKILFKLLEKEPFYIYNFPIIDL
jgi:hypothetical protein